MTISATNDGQPIEDRAVSIPEEGTIPQPATHEAIAVINGVRTTVRASLADAKARGWEVTGPVGGPRHKSRTAAAPAPAETPEAAPAKPDGTKDGTDVLTPAEEAEALRSALNGFTVEELTEQARDRDLSGYSRLNKAELIDLLIESQP